MTTARDLSRVVKFALSLGKDERDSDTVGSWRSSRLSLSEGYFQGLADLHRDGRQPSREALLELMHRYDQYLVEGD